MKFVTVLSIAMLFAVPSFADIVVSPSSIMFGTAKVGNPGFQQRTISVRNTGTKTENIQVSGFCSQDFFVSNSCFSLPQYGSCSITVQFRPTRVGYHNCSYNIRGSNGSGGTLSISGSGN